MQQIDKQELFWLHPNYRNAMRSTAVILLLLALIQLLAWLIPASPGATGIPNYLPLHVLLETVSIVVSMMVFAVGWNSHSKNYSGNIVLLACVFFSVGVLDFMHTVSYGGMPDFISHNDSQKHLNFWLSARFFAAVVLLVVAVRPWKPLGSKAIHYVIFASLIIATALINWLVVYHQAWLPDTFISGEGLTTFKKNAEYLIIVFNIVTAIIFWQKMREPQTFNVVLLFGAVCILAMSEFFFTLYTTMTGRYNVLGHIYKVIAYLFIYRAIVVETIEEPYNKLELAQQKLATALRASSTGLWDLDLRTNVIIYSPAWKAQLGYLPDELPDQFSTWELLLHPDDLAPAMERVQSFLSSSQQQYENEFRMCHRDGSYRWIMARGEKEYDANGKLVRLIGSHIDITERRKAEETLRMLSLAVEQSHSSVIITDPNANIEYVNQAFLNETGYSSGEVVGQNPRLLNSGKNPASVFREMWVCLIGGEAWQGELVNLRKDGSEYIVSILISPVRSADGDITHYLGVREDITERKNRDAEIVRLNRAYYLLSQVNETIVRAQDRNELFTAICQAAVASALFRFVWIGMLDEKRALVIPVAYAGVEEGYTDQLSIRLDDERSGNGPVGIVIRTDAHVICQDIENDPIMAPWRDEALKRGYRVSGGFPIHEAGVVVGVISFYAVDAHSFTPDIIQLMLELAADISFALDVFAEKMHRKQAESDLKQLNIELERRVKERTDQLELANNELEAFSYSVSHDLRAPLRSIDGFSQILSKKYHDSLDDTGRDYLGRVRRASQRMGLLIDDLLRLAQVTRSPLKRKQIDLSVIATKVVEDLRKTQPARQVHFVLQPGLSAYADPGLLHVVMNNLLGNACKFSGKKADARIEFGSINCNGENAFFIRDNGAGFNMDYAHKLFGAFQRLHGTNEFEGTGIGLATVQRIIHRHHGKVWAEGHEGTGATFYFTLPQREREA